MWYLWWGCRGNLILITLGSERVNAPSASDGSCRSVHGDQKFDSTRKGRLVNNTRNWTWRDPCIKLAYCEISEWTQERNTTFDFRPLELWTSRVCNSACISETTQSPLAIVGDFNAQYRNKTQLYNLNVQVAVSLSELLTNNICQCVFVTAEILSHSSSGAS